MGLDTVELVIRFEDTFGIDIPDDVATQLTTPGEVAEYILSRLELTDQTACMSQQAFYRLRKEFIPALGIPRSDFRPEIDLAQLIPISDRIQIWSSIGSKIGVSSLPQLGRPKWVVRLLTVMTVLTALAVFVYVRGASDSIQSGIVLSLLTASALAYAAAVATRPLKRLFPDDYRHVGDLAHYLALKNPQSFKKEWTRKEVVRMVREVIIDQTGITDFTADSRFVQDMHLD